jgi:hypothetical protein
MQRTCYRQLLDAIKHIRCICLFVESQGKGLERPRVERQWTLPLQCLRQARYERNQRVGNLNGVGEFHRIGRSYSTCPHLLFFPVVVPEYKVVRCQMNRAEEGCAILCAGNFLDLHEAEGLWRIEMGEGYTFDTRIASIFVERVPSQRNTIAQSDFGRCAGAPCGLACLRHLD